MSDTSNGSSLAARANLLLKLNSERKLDAERLAKHEYRVLLADLDADGLLFPKRVDQPLGQHGFHRPDARTYRATHAGLPPLSVPLGTIATSDQPADLPALGLLIKDETADALKRALRGFFGEHHSKPFCRPVFLVDRLDILPFFRRFEFAAYAEKSGWDADAISMIKQRHSLAQVRDLISGTEIL